MDQTAIAKIVAFLWLYHELIVFILLTLGLIVALIHWWDEVKYFFLNFRWGFPVLGRIARARGRAPETKYVYQGARVDAVEDELCEAYYKYYEQTLGKDGHFFQCCENFLNKTEQLRRREKGVLLWIATFVLVACEAVGFAFVLVPFINRNVSANLADILAWLIAIMLSLILVPMADQTGRQWHKNSLLEKIRVWYRSARGRNAAEALQPNTAINIETTHLDDGPEVPNYLKMRSRIDCGAHAETEWRISAVTVIFIAVIAVGAYIIRSNTIQGLEAEEVNASPFAAASAHGDNSLFDLPDAAKADNKQADDRTAREVTHAKIVAYKTTFVMLSVIFVGVQIFGIMIGYLYSLTGKLNVEAARYIRNFNNAKEYEDYYKQARNRIARDAQAKLAALQQVIYRDDVGANNAGRDAKPTFLLFLQKKLEDETVVDTAEALHAAKRRSAAATARNYSGDAGQLAKAQPAAFVASSAVAAASLSAASAPTDAITSLPAASAPTDAIAARIQRLGSLLDLTDAELGQAATDLQVPLENLRRAQALQKRIAAARGA